MLEELLNTLDTPEKIQKFIDDEITYDPHREDRSVEEVVMDRFGECYNGALLACAALHKHGYEASFIMLYAKDDEEHVICVYKNKETGMYGSIGQSKFLGLKSREPIYLNIHDLAVSYKEFYFAYDGHYTLYSYTELFPLEQYENKWLNEPKVVIEMEEELKKMPRTPITADTEILYYVSPDRYWAETLVFLDGVDIPERYLKYKNKH